MDRTRAASWSFSTICSAILLYKAGHTLTQAPLAATHLSPACQLPVCRLACDCEIAASGNPPHPPCHPSGLAAISCLAVHGVGGWRKAQTEQGQPDCRSVAAVRRSDATSILIFSSVIWPAAASPRSKRLPEGRGDCSSQSGSVAAAISRRYLFVVRKAIYVLNSQIAISN